MIGFTKLVCQGDVKNCGMIMGTNALAAFEFHISHCNGIEILPASSEYLAKQCQAHSQKNFLGSAFEEKVDLLILYMYHSPGAVEEFVIVGCMLIAHIHEGLYLCF